MTEPSFRLIDDLRLDRIADARIYEHGWQSWSPTGLYPVTATSPRPRREAWQTMAFRPDRPAPASGFQGEGLLGVVQPTGPVRTYVARDPSVEVPSVRASLDGDLVHVTSDGPVDVLESPTLEAALTRVAARLATHRPEGPVRGVGPGWCSWYGYADGVTEAVVAENLAAMDRHGLDVRVVQIDDGHQAGIGDWLQPSGRIPSMPSMADRIRDGGREAGVWTAPFLVGAHSRLAREHPEWLVRGAIAAQQHWGQPVGVLDVTHPDVADHLTTVFRTLRAWGFTFHKVDFLYGGAMPGGRYGQAEPIAAYREGLRIIREAIGDDATILGCGAPLLPSIGLVDAMRIGPDVAEHLEPIDGDISQPSMRGALAAGRARAWMHGRLWVNDPDCILAAGSVEGRDTWVDHVEAYGGLSMSGDRLPDLDPEGLAITRRLLRPSQASAPRWDPDVGPDGGRIVPTSTEDA